MEHDITHGLGSSETSLFDQLASAREETAENRETFIVIPGYESSGMDLLARYRLVDGPELEEIARRVEGKGKRRQRGLWSKNLSAALDTMARACTGIYIQRPTDEEPVPLTVGGEAVSGYGDPNLKTALKIKDESIDTTRKMIVKVFCDNELAISSHSVKLNRWFQNTGLEVDEELLGEA